MCCRIVFSCLCLVRFSVIAEVLHDIVCINSAVTTSSAFGFFLTESATLFHYTEKHDVYPCYKKLNKKGINSFSF